MAHYTAREWYLFKLAGVDPRKRRRMENHLAGCPDCLQAYLSTIDRNEIEAAGKILPPGFARQVMNTIQLRRHSVPAHASRRGALLRYIAAAAAAFLLTVSGYFDWAARDLSGALGKTSVVSRAIAETANLNWSDYLVVHASERINGLIDYKGGLNRD